MSLKIRLLELLPHLIRVNELIGSAGNKSACLSVSELYDDNEDDECKYRQVSNIRCTKFQSLNDSHLVLHLSLPHL